MSQYFYTLFSRLILVGGQLVFIKIISKALAPADLGTYYSFLSASYLLNAGILIPLDYYQQSRVGSVMSKHSTLSPLIRLNVRVLVALLILTFALALLAYFIAPRIGPLIALSACLAISSYLPLAMRGALNILGHARKVNLTQAMEGILKPSLAFLASSVMSPRHVSAFLIIGSNIFASSLVFFALAAAFRALGLVNPTHVLDGAPTSSEVTRVAFPITLSALLNWIQLQGYRAVLFPLGFAEVIGVYSVMSNLGQAAMAALSGIYSQVNLPQMYKTRGVSIKRYLRNGCFLIGTSAIGAWVASPYLVPLVTTRAYVNFSELVVFGVLIEGINLLIGAYVVYFAIESKTGSVAFAGGVAAFVSASGMFLLYKYGRLDPASIGLVLLCSQLAAIGLLVCTRKRMLAID